MKRCKEENIATFLWMTVADGDDCKIPKWSNVSLKDAMVKGYYREAGYNAITTIENDCSDSNTQLYNLNGTKVLRPSSNGIYIKKGKKFVLHVGSGK